MTERCFFAGKFDSTGRVHVFLNRNQVNHKPGNLRLTALKKKVTLGMFCTILGLKVRV